MCCWEPQWVVLGDSQKQRFQWETLNFLFLNFHFPFLIWDMKNFPPKLKISQSVLIRSYFPKTAVLSLRAAMTYPLTNTPHCSWWACWHFRVSHSSYISDCKRIWRCFRGQKRTSHPVPSISQSTDRHVGLDGSEKMKAEKEEKFMGRSGGVDSVFCLHLTLNMLICSRESTPALFVAISSR